MRRIVAAPPRPGDKRVIQKFILVPRILKNQMGLMEYRRWEWSYIVEEYISSPDSNMWFEIAWAHDLFGSEEEIYP